MRETRAEERNSDGVVQGDGYERIRTAIESVDPGEPGQTSRAQVLHPDSWRFLQTCSVNASPFSRLVTSPLVAFPFFSSRSILFSLARYTRDLNDSFFLHGWKEAVISEHKRRSKPPGVARARQD